MFWLSSFFLPFILQIQILPFFQSDHAYVYLKLALPCCVHCGRGIWKFNVSHLSDEAFTNMVTQFWQSWRSARSSFLSLSAWWDAGKLRLRNKIRAHSRKQAACHRQRLQSLQRTLFHLNRQKARGARIRAQAQWAEEGEAPTSYFFRLEKTHGRRKLFHSIRNLAGMVVSSLSAICTAWMEFYVQLFTSQALDRTEQQFFLSCISSKLSDAQLLQCEGPLTQAECERALDGMAGGKSPGTDGLPAEFYKRFWSLLGQDYVDVMNYCFTHGRLSTTQRSGVISLLHKKGDWLNMKNWRAITLVCVDYKIAAKALANRLLSVLPLLIHADQSCGVPGRNLSENCRLLKDVVADANQHNTGVAILSFDQEKAFDG